LNCALDIVRIRESDVHQSVKRFLSLSFYVR
jgi:hypothetical protein